LFILKSEEITPSFNHQLFLFQPFSFSVFDSIPFRPSKMDFVIIMKFVATHPAFSFHPPHVPHFHPRPAAQYGNPA
jgi:hypothetical protein